MNAAVTKLLDSELATSFSFERVALHRDGGAPAKLAAAASGMVRVLSEMLFNRPDGAWIHATKGASLGRKSVVVLAARALRIPTALHLHSEQALRHLESTGRAGAAYYRRVLGSAAVVIVLDPDWIPRVRAVGARDAVFVPNGVEVPEQRAQIAPDNHRIAMVGMLNANKGSYVAVRAVGLARSRFPDIHLDLVGGGDTAGVQTLVTEVGIQGNVDVHGWLAPEEVDRLLDDSAMVILPSRREGIPMALLEAMSHGIPVVATPVGGIPRLLGDGRFGILTPVDDPVALAGAITGLLTDSEAARALGLRGRQQVADNYSLAVVTRQLREVLENLVS